MNDFNLFEYGAYIATASVGWFVGIIWNRQEKIKEEMSDLKETLPVNYIRRDEFREVIHELKTGFKEAIIPVLNKLDRMEVRMEEQSRENDRIYKRRDE